MKCYIKKNMSFSGLARESRRIPNFIGITLAITSMFLFPASVHAGFFDWMKDCTGNTAPSLSAFLYLFVQIMQWILGITGSLALLMFVIGGFMWLISGGTEKMVNMGKATLINALIGLAIVFGSWLLIDFVLGAVMDPGMYNKGDWYSFSSKLCNEPQVAGFGEGGVAALQGPDKKAKERLIPGINETVLPDVAPSATAETIARLAKKPPLKCKPKAAEEAKCKLAQKQGKKTEIVEYENDPSKPDGKGKKCATGMVRCIITDRAKRTCPADYKQPTSLIGCTCGTLLVNTETGEPITIEDKKGGRVSVTDSKKVPKGIKFEREQLIAIDLYAKEGGVKKTKCSSDKSEDCYYCCKCGRKKFVASGVDCGESMPPDIALEIMDNQVSTRVDEQKYKCCDLTQKGMKGKKACIGGDDLRVQNTGRQCYCSVGIEMSPCVRNAPMTGCRGDSVCLSSTEVSDINTKIINHDSSDKNWFESAAGWVYEKLGGSVINLFLDESLRKANTLVKSDYFGICMHKCYKDWQSNTEECKTYWNEHATK